MWLRVVLHGLQRQSPQRHCFLDLWPTVQVMARCQVTTEEKRSTEEKVQVKMGCE